MSRDRTLVYGLTFTVALCSIVYELIYSEMLTVVFGGRAIRYAITIGLFLFCLGLGAFAFDDLGDARENFFRVESYLAGPARKPTATSAGSGTPRCATRPTPPTRRCAATAAARPTTSSTATRRPSSVCSAPT